MNNIILNKQEKRELVIKLLQENKTYREIQEIGHIAPNFITKIKREEFGEQYVESENENSKKNKLSKRTQCIDLFNQGKKPYEIINELDISVDEVKKGQLDYLQLLDLDNISQIVQDTKNSNLLNDFYNLFMIFKELGINTVEKVKKIKELVDVYPHLEYEISQLNKEIRNLKQKKQIDEQVLNDIKYKISTSNTSLQTIENQISSKKIILENLEILEKRKSSSVYNDNIKKIIEPIIKDESWYKTTVLPLFIVSVFKIIRDDPMGKFMILDYYNYNPVPFNNNDNNISSIKETDIEDTINYLHNNFLPIIMDIYEYSQKLHNIIHKIYPSYLFSKIIKMSSFDNSNSIQNNLLNKTNNNQFHLESGPGLNNNNSYIE